MRIRLRAIQAFLLFFLLDFTSATFKDIDAPYHTDQDVSMAESLKSHSPLDVEKYPVAPSGLELEQVHIYVRHGERTPVGVRLAGPPANLPEHWMMCKTARRLQASVNAPGIDGAMDEFQQSRKMVERADGTHKEGQCLLGELTDLGRKSTYSFGTSLRKLYVEKLGFLPDLLQNAGEVYFRTTNVPRTTESLQQIVHGLYPSSKCHSEAIPLIFVRNGRDENLLGNAGSCKRLEILLVGFAQAAASAYNHTLEPLDKKISKYLDGHPIRIDGKPRASGILDTIRAATAHNVKVPPEFEEKAVIDVIEKAVVAECLLTSESLLDKTEEVRRLGMGRLLDDLSTKMQHKVLNRDKDPLKILVHSTHDTALAGLASTLDVFDDKWPQFTSSISFELFKSTPTGNGSSFLQTLISPFRSKASPEHYIRMRYQNKNMILPMCADEGKHLPGSPEFCTLTAFRERVKELTPLDFVSECAPAGRNST
ncbi:histidine phosphatase superfamily [Lentinula aff. detonsa]|uniref:Histidine phosphatase superfamily n=1 Tax=Lentinula aff. detonsa TaxID=2804958 RepID=A0AA38KMX0_9AGAR|nr:histidine phosphatase superfamily [Lentinula aff. detonsa]KAJ3799785.1 histidine phosphatase superfamily [Lentinula aff. detonsa]